MNYINHRLEADATTGIAVLEPERERRTPSHAAQRQTKCRASLLAHYQGA
jgi:hypothetical protein